MGEQTAYSWGCECRKHPLRFRIQTVELMHGREALPSMRLTFLGAARMVTGSSYLLEAAGMRILVDCGLFQGRDESKNREPFHFNPSGIDGVILTHAHIDHSGRLPLLCKRGFRGPIWTHPATADLAEIMLADSAHIQETDTERSNRRSRRAGRTVMEEPLYTMEDARRVVGLFQPIPYGALSSVGEGLQVRFTDAGHILGSAIVEIFETDPAGKRTKLVFSGDLGQPGRPILKDPAPIDEADYLVLESTYGNRLHEAPESKREALGKIIHSTVAKGGKVIIPAFAVGRTQEILYELSDLVEAKKLPRDLKVVLDSPLAIAATRITAQHHDIFDSDERHRIDGGDKPFHFRGLIMTQTAEESMALNAMKQPLVIVAASGMCEAGRVVHHLRHNLWREVSTVLFVGFQAEGTLGRRIADGASRVRIYGEDVAVRCRIESLQGFSAHADQAQLLDWVDGLHHRPAQIFLVHGEQEAQEELANCLAERGHRVEIPDFGESIELAPGGEQLSRPIRGTRTKKTKRQNRAKPAIPKGEALAISSQRMSALLRDLRDLKKVWFANGPHLDSEKAVEVADRADEVMKALDEIRRLMT